MYFLCPGAVSKELDKAQDGPSQAMCAAADSQPNLQPLQAELQGGAEDEHSDKPTHLVQGPGQGGGKDAELKPIGVVQQQLALGQGEVALMLPERVPRNKVHTFAWISACLASLLSRRMHSYHWFGTLSIPCIFRHAFHHASLYIGYSF